MKEWTEQVGKCWSWTAYENTQPQASKIEQHSYGLRPFQVFQQRALPTGEWAARGGLPGVIWGEVGSEVRTKDMTNLFLIWLNGQLIEYWHNFKYMSSTLGGLDKALFFPEDRSWCLGWLFIVRRGNKMFLGKIGLDPVCMLELPGKF